MQDTFDECFKMHGSEVNEEALKEEEEKVVVEGPVQESRGMVVQGEASAKVAAPAQGKMGGGGCQIHFTL